MKISKETLFEPGEQVRFIERKLERNSETNLLETTTSILVGTIRNIILEYNSGNKETFVKYEIDVPCKVGSIQFTVSESSIFSVVNKDYLKTFTTEELKAELESR